MLNLMNKLFCKTQDIKIIPSKISRKSVWANSADQDQTAPEGAVWSGSTLFAIQSASSGDLTAL